MNDYDHRQVLLMLEALNAFERGATDLPALISSLEALAGCLETPSPTWKESFRGEWGKLEEAYSYSMASDQSSLGPEGWKLVAEATQNLRRLLNQSVEHVG